MLFYPPLEAEALPINTPLDPPSNIKNVPSLFHRGSFRAPHLFP